MGYQRIVTLVVALVLVLGGVFYFQSRSTNNDKTLHILTWSNYFPDKAIQEFTAKTGVKVELSYMSSNEELFSKLKAGATGYDVIQPSDYMVRRMTDLHMLKQIDSSKIPNLSHLDNYYKTMPYDPGLRHSVPFTWGTTGIAVNTKKVPIPASGVDWSFLLRTPDPKHTSVLDDMREVFAAVLKSEGKSINSKNIADYESARGTIQKLKTQVLTFSSEPKALLLKGEINIAHIFSVDAIQAGRENPDIKYFIPKEGGTIWTDNFAIPTTSKNPEEAHAFINYFLDPDNALVILKENQLATPNKSAKLKLSPEEQNNPGTYPGREVLDKMQFLEDLGNLGNQLNQMWTELKS